MKIKQRLNSTVLSAAHAYQMRRLEKMLLPKKHLGTNLEINRLEMIDSILAGERAFAKGTFSTWKDFEKELVKM